MEPQENKLASETPMEPAKAIRVAQIICVALMAGLSMFFLVAVLMSGQNNPAFLSYVGLGFSVVGIILSFVIPGVAVRDQLKQIVESPAGQGDFSLFPVFQTKLIIGLALLEGTGFFNLICYLQEHQWWTLAVVGYLLLLMAMRYPTLAKFESWAEDQKRDLQNRFEAP